MTCDVWRCNCRGIGGLVDYLGTLDADTQGDAQNVALEMFDLGPEEYFDIQEADENIVA